MITFKELRITPNDRNLIIEASVDTLDYYNNIVIDSVIIDTQDTFVPNGPSEKAIYTKNVGNLKDIRLVLDEEDLGTDIKGNMFFVYIITSGEFAPNTPIEYKATRALGTAINLYPIYKQSINYVNEMNNCCCTPKRFIDFILRTKAIDLAIKTGNYLMAIKYWNKFYKNIGFSAEVYKECKCYDNNI